jgi:formate dehydrogenase alpha subunit
MYIILQNGWQNDEFIEKHTQGFDELKQSVEKFTPANVTKITGVTEETLKQAAEILSKESPMAVVWSVDLATHPTGRENVTSLVNFQLLLGNFGVGGGGLIPLRSHNNSQGACDMGGHPAYYPGYQAVDESSTRRKFEAAWGKGIPTKVGMAAREMMVAAAEGKLRALYILSEDLVSNAPNGPQIRRSLGNCDFVILEGVFESETSRCADVLLPGVTFAEKTGTFTSTERRIQMVRQAIAPQGESRPDWQIIAELARRIKSNGVNGFEHAGWNYSDTSQIMAEIAMLTPIYAGISHERLEHADLQWPVKNLGHSGTQILSVENFRNTHALFTRSENEGEKKHVESI